MSDRTTHDGNGDNSPPILFELFNSRLVGSVMFESFYYSLPERAQSDSRIKRLGIVTHQLYEYFDAADVDDDGGDDTTDTQITFDSIETTPDRKLGVVRERASQIEDRLAGDSRAVVISKREVSHEVSQLVEEFLAALEDEISSSRLQLATEYCTASGLTTPEYEGSESDSDPSKVVSSADIGIDEGCIESGVGEDEYGQY